MTPELLAILQNLKPCSEQDHRKHLLTTQIFPMIEKWGFEKEFQQELTELHVQQQSILSKLTDRLESNTGAIVALVGERGVGKTSLCAQFALKVAWKNYWSGIEGSGFRKHVIYKKLSALLSRYKPLYGDMGSLDMESLAEARDRLIAQEFLIIDETHECGALKAAPMLLTDIVDRRYAARRPTVLIANQEPQEFQRSAGDSIISRLNQYGVILPCNKIPTYRVQK